MAEIIEREYIIPLRKEWSKVPRYKRTMKSVKAIKEFIARHMRVNDRDINKVKLDVYLNNEIWFRGSKKPPTKVRVKARKEGDIVKVEFVEVPQRVKFIIARQEKIHKKIEKKEVKPEERKEQKEEKLEEKLEEKKEEKEKAKAVEKEHEKIAERAAKVEKHLSKDKKVLIHRQALKK